MRWFFLKKTIRTLGIVLPLLILFCCMFQITRQANTVTAGGCMIHRGKYHIFVDCEASKLYLFENGQLIKTYPCAGGKPSTPSPVGTWKIVSKGDWTGGFGGSWMGFNVPWGKFGIHGTDKPYSIGWNSSHGCIRMYNDDARQLMDTIPSGTKVTIEDGTLGDFSRGFRTLTTGTYGADVKRIQIALKERGYFKGTPYGYFDSGMLYAVKAFQKDNGLTVQDRITRNFYEKLGLIEFE